MDRVHERHDGLEREGPPVEVGDHALAHPLPPAVQGRHVETAQGGKALEDLRALQTPLFRPEEDPGDLRDDLLALADDEGVEEGGHGQRVERAGSPGDHDGVAVAPVLRAQGHAPEVEQGQDVRVGKLVLQGDADEIEGRKRRARLEGREPQPARPQPGFHVRPGGVDALGADVRVGVQDGVEDLQAQVGHAHLVGVGKGQGNAKAAGGAVLDRGVGLAAGVSAGLLDEGQKGLETAHVGSVAGHVHLFFSDCAQSASSSTVAGQPHPTAKVGRQEEQKSGVDWKFMFVPSALPHFRSSDLPGMDAFTCMQGTRGGSPECSPSPARGTSTVP
ncbi:MAG: hypothetical protein A4E67_01433 [Syntrophaceae bacterium PtaB.Bin038]|nr:MAG: hypothetical protein A4E67_01433 [Syntrophaceae bacterium PtaB.Bin038]